MGNKKRYIKEMISEYEYSAPRVGCMALAVLFGLIAMVGAFAFMFLTIINLITK
jgi:hypothetical protein